MKVLLVSFYNEEAYGLRSLHSCLVADNVDARMLFFKIESKHYRVNHDDELKKNFNAIINEVTEKESKLFLDFISEFKPDVIAFSLVSSNFHLYKRIYSRIKNLDGFKIIIGGWQPSLNPEECIHYTDYLCIGEGERAICELIRKLRDCEPVDNIENFWINKETTIVKNKVRPLTDNISSFPLPLFDDKFSYSIENSEIVSGEPYSDNIRYGTFIGRGCPYHCTYCSNSYMAKNIYPKSWAKTRYRNIEHVMNELRIVKEKLTKVHSINFYDEVFSPSMDWIKVFFKKYKEEIAIPFYCMFFPGSCSEEQCKVLTDAGLKGVWLGVQSGSERVRREVFKRYYKNGKILEQAQIFHKHGVDVRYDFIFDNPFETFKESLESIYLMFELPQPFSLTPFSLKFFPNTEITKMALKAGFITKSSLDDQRDKSQDNYCVRMDNTNAEQKFIDYLAVYISFISRIGKLKKQKKMLMDITEDYKVNKDISAISQLLQPYLCNKGRAVIR